MLTVAVWIPPTDGSKRMVKVVVPPPDATGEEGWLVTLKWDAPAPDSCTNGAPVKVKSPDPLLVIVKM